MWEFIVAYCSPLIEWCKGNIAGWHASTNFNVFGIWLVDKFQAMAFIVFVVVFAFAAFFVIVGLMSPDKLDNNQRRRPPY